ncbi:MAG: glycolate oxidase subunit GlcE [Acidiferrobacteraceae bacterium]|nr:glycolate oxidase subunit GlcE [Acidiferrobacteraceae bacterium]
MTETRGIQEQVREALSSETPVSIVGGNTKSFLKYSPVGDKLEMKSCQGLVDYEPSELVITVRGGTLLMEVEEILNNAGQMLPFEPPRFGPGSTIGGVVASGFSGPRRPFTGAIRDFVLGVGLVNGRGEALHFGGRVIKNVAGYDLSRLMAGAMGTLGVLTEISLKVVPRPEVERSLRFEFELGEAITRVNQWLGYPYPISATAWEEGVLTLRLSGSSQGVEAATRKLGGAVAEDLEGYWSSLRDLTHPFFSGSDPLWRFSLPPATPPLKAPEAPSLVDWGGAQRWVRGRYPSSMMILAAEEARGWVTLVRGGEGPPEGSVLPDRMITLHRRVKEAFDPQGILNPGRLPLVLG